MVVRCLFWLLLLFAGVFGISYAWSCKFQWRKNSKTTSRKIFNAFLKKNITGLNYLDKKNFNLYSCKTKCTDDNLCKCFYYRTDNHSCSIMSQSICDMILNSSLPDINNTFTVLTVYHGKKDLGKKFSFGSMTVKYPNISAYFSSQCNCYRFCLDTINCCGYSYHNKWCQLLFMTNCWNYSVLVLQPEEKLVHLTHPITWKFDRSNNYPSGSINSTKSSSDDSTKSSSTSWITTSFIKSPTPSGSSSGIIQLSSIQHTSAIIDASSITATRSICSCECDRGTQPPPTKEELEDLKNKLQKELAVDKKKLSSTIRAKTSAPDERTSATCIGSVGVILLSALPIFIIIIDLPQLYEDLITFYKNLSRLCSNRTQG